MKKIITIIAVCIIAASCRNPNYNPYTPVGPGTYHTCIDPTHKICDGQCECDGLGCTYSLNSKYALQSIPARDYQLEVVEDSLLVFDGHRHVGTIPFGNTAIDSLIMADNE